MRIWPVVLSILLVFSSLTFAQEPVEAEKKQPPAEPLVGSWTFSGTVTNESGDRYGYFFQMQRQGSDFHAKTALIDGQTNKLLLFYEGDETIDKSTALDWHVGRSFIRYNPINDSYIFGLKLEDKKGFNFKVDMFKQEQSEDETLVLRPGVELQALQTSRLNGNVQIGVDNKEQFVTGNKAWFGKLWFSRDQKAAHDISTTFCRLANDNGFYSANLKEKDATGGAVAGWRDAAGGKVKMSQFISIKSLGNNESLLNVGLPKLKLKLFNTLKSADKSPLWLAGFSKENPTGFCYVAEQSFAKAYQPESGKKIG
ncbi:MAG: hypothetical protein ACHP6H_06515 [Legionellales bacterium]